ncbi:hypothetical protein C0431_10135 [bacterium]|jgi:hypothetical protein|nr:hypothetical protein [bacterium]
MVDGRINPEGVPRDQLTWVLTQAKMVRDAVRIDRCLLCRDPAVNEAGICGVCWTYLTPEEVELATNWSTGVMPE